MDPIPYKSADMTSSAPFLLLCVPGDSDGSTTIRDAVFECVDVARLMLSREALVVAFAILLDVLSCDLPERFAHFQDHVVAAILHHRRHREVGMATSAIPIAISGLGSKDTKTL